MYCEECRKTGLSKNEVEKDHKLNKILCLGCYKLANPEWQPPENNAVVPIAQVLPPQGFGYAVCLDSRRGLSAQVSYGEVALELVIPNQTLKNVLGVR